MPCPEGAASASLPGSGVTGGRGGWPEVWAVTSVLLRGAEGTASSRAEQRCFLQGKGKMMRFWSSVSWGRAVVCVSEMWNRADILNRCNCVIAGFPCCVCGVVWCYPAAGMGWAGCLVPDSRHCSYGEKCLDVLMWTQSSIWGVLLRLPPALSSLHFPLFHSLCTSHLPGGDSRIPLQVPRLAPWAVLQPCEPVHFGEEQFWGIFVVNVWIEHGGEDHCLFPLGNAAVGIVMHPNGKHHAGIRWEANWIVFSVFISLRYILE